MMKSKTNNGKAKFLNLLVIENDSLIIIDIANKNGVDLSSRKFLAHYFAILISNKIKIFTNAKVKKYIKNFIPTEDKNPILSFESLSNTNGTTSFSDNSSSN